MRVCDKYVTIVIRQWYSAGFKLHTGRGSIPPGHEIKEESSMTTVAKDNENENVHDDGEQTAYYRSQEEVDHAFGKRLAHERTKWEKAQKEAQKGEPEAEGEAGGEEDALVEAMAAYEQQVPASGENPAIMIDRATDAAVDNAQHAAFLLGIAQQAEALSEKMPFDLAREMENPVFAMLLATDAPLRDVMEYVHPELKSQRLRADAEREVVERIRARNQRPAPLTRANASSQMDVAALTDEQIREIDRRVKRGERVVL